MEKLNKTTIKNCVTDLFVHMIVLETFYDITVWMNTIKKGRYDDTNQLFELSNNATHVITDYNYQNVLKEIRDKL